MCRWVGKSVLTSTGPTRTRDHDWGFSKLAKMGTEIQLDLRRQDFRGQVSDVRRNLPPRQELCHFVAEGVTVVFKEVVGLTSVHQEKGLENRYEKVGKHPVE